MTLTKAILAKRLSDYAAYLAVRLIVCLIQAVSLETCQAWARRLAWLMWHVVRLRRDVVDQNIATAFPQCSASERAAIALEMWEHLFVMVCEIAHAPRKIHRTNWRSHSTFPQLPVMLPLLLADRPVVFISGHLGNFEMGGYLLGLHGFPTHTIARPLDNPYLNRWINEFRAATGQFMLAKEGCAEKIADLLAAGGTLVLLGDQHAGDSACWVDFFGKPASTNKSVALFTLVGRAPTGVAAVLRGDKPLDFELSVSDVVDPVGDGFELGSIPLVAQWYTRQLERMIRRAPGQYWWLHRRWRTPPERIQRRKAA